MTATTKPSDLPALPVLLDQTTAIAQAREQNMGQMQTSLNQVWSLTESLAEPQRTTARTALMATWDVAQTMSTQWGETQELLMRSVTLVQAQQWAVEELTRQREAVLDEMSQLLNAIQHTDLNHPVVMTFYGEMYDSVADDHNASVWERLPYDIAGTMGEEWTHMDADTLYHLIADEELDINAEAEHWTLEQIQWARHQMLKIVRQMRTYQHPTTKDE